MVVFPATLPRLDIVAAAGQAIPAGTSSGVSIALPVGTTTNQTVTVQARDFIGMVPIDVVVTPDSQPSRTFSGSINMTSNPAQVTLEVIVPEGTRSVIHAWTR